MTKVVGFFERLSTVGKRSKTRDFAGYCSLKIAFPAKYLHVGIWHSILYA